MATNNSANTYIVPTSNNEVTMPSQPAFLAYLGTDDNNVTGNAATFTLGSGNALTEVFDQGGDFVTTGTFTAPVTGRYLLGYSLFIGDLTAAMTYGFQNIITSNGTYPCCMINVGAVRTVAAAPNNYQPSSCVLADMDSSDTCTVTLRIDGGAGNTADLLQNSRRINMWGLLVC